MSVTALVELTYLGVHGVCCYVRDVLVLRVCGYGSVLRCDDDIFK